VLTLIVLEVTLSHYGAAMRRVMMQMAGDGVT
jgi:hypothetical protein